MSDRKRKRKGKPRKRVRCSECTPHRWRGNAAARWSIRDRKAMQDGTDSEP